MIYAFISFLDSERVFTMSFIFFVPLRTFSGRKRSPIAKCHKTKKLRKCTEIILYWSVF